MCVDGGNDTRVGGVSLVRSVVTSTPLQTTTGHHTHPHNCKWMAVYVCVCVSAAGRVLTAVSELNDVNWRLTGACDMRCTPRTRIHTHCIRISYKHSHTHLGVYYISAVCVYLKSERERERVSERCLGTTNSISIDRVNRKRFRAEYSTTYGFCTGPPSVRRGDCDDGTFIIALIKHTTRRDR